MKALAGALAVGWLGRSGTTAATGSRCRPGRAGSDCAPCQAGTFAALEGQRVCDLFPGGSVRNAERTGCVCPPGTVLDQWASCVSCPPGLVFHAETGTCVGP